MQLNEINFGDAQPVEGYGPGFFRIGGQVIQGPVLCHPGGVAAWGGLEDLDVRFVACGAIAGIGCTGWDGRYCGQSAISLRVRQ